MSKEELQEDIHAVIRADLQFFHVKRYRDRWLPLFFRPASVRDYEEWLWPFMRNGGQPTHYYDYDMPINAFFVALGDFNTNPLYGSLAVSMIVPKQFCHIGGDLGHSNLYMMKGLVNVGGWIPIYEGMKVPDDLRAKVTAFKNEQEERRAKFRNRHLQRDPVVESWRSFLERERERERPR